MQTFPILLGSVVASTVMNHTPTTSTVIILWLAQDGV